MSVRALDTQTKAIFLICLLATSEGARVQAKIDEGAGANKSAIPSDIGIRAVSVVAGGNVQFQPIFDVAHFMMETAPAAAKGAGMLAKPVVTGATASGAVQMGTKAGLLGKLVGGAVGLTTPMGIFQVGLTVYQLWEFQQMMKDPNLQCYVAALIPPYSTAACGDLGGIGDSILTKDDKAVIVASTPESRRVLSPQVILAASAVLLVSGGALWFWHANIRQSAYDQAMCPREHWSLDKQLPTTMRLRGRAGADAEGMPRCDGLRKVNVPARCADDVECRRATCRQACCDDETCSMFQFNMGKHVSCWLGDASKSFTEETCDEWFGEAWSTNRWHADPALVNQVLGLKKATGNWKDGGKSAHCTTANLKPGEKTADCMVSSCRSKCYAEDGCKFYQFQMGSTTCWLSKTPLSSSGVQRWYGGIMNRDSAPNLRSCDAGTWECPGKHGPSCVTSCSECSGFSLAGTDGRCARSAEQAVCDPDSWSKSYQENSLNSTVCTGLKKQVVVMTEDTELNGHAVCREACCSDPKCVLYQVRRDFAMATSLSVGSKVHCWLGKVDSSFNPLFTCGVAPVFRKWEGGHLLRRGCQENQFACLVTNECVASCAAECPGAANSDAVARSCVGVGEEEQQFTETDPGPTDQKAAQENLLDAETTITTTIIDKSFTETTSAVGDEEQQLTETYAGLTDQKAAQENSLDVDTITSTTSGKSYYLHKDQGNHTAASENANADMLMLIAQNIKNLITKTSPSACDLLVVGAVECTPHGAGCSCEYFRKQQCDTWFEGPEHLRPIVTGKGMLLLTGEACECAQTRTPTGSYTCHFGFLNAIPKVRLAENDDVALELS